MSVAEVPISVIIEQISEDKPANIQAILSTLFLSKNTISKASKTDINHLVGRVNNLLNSNDGYKIWYGAHLVQVLSFNPIIVTTGGKLFFTSLLKIANNSSLSANKLVFKNAVLAVDAIIKSIRGKPVLTREILTPNIPAIIQTLLDNFSRDVKICLGILNSLILKNTTTFKPFMNKFEDKLLYLLNHNFDCFDDKFQKLVCKSFAYLNLVKPKNNNSGGNGGAQELPDDAWRAKIFKLLDEIRSVVSVYENVLEIKEEKELTKLINSLPNYEKKEYIFPSLKVDFNDPISVLVISKRLDMLVKLLIAFISSPTPFHIRVPFGLIYTVGEILTGLSLNYIPIKAELRRNEQVRKIIFKDISKTQSIGVKLINEMITTFELLMTPHLSSILSTLEVTIPIKAGGSKKQRNGKSKIDEELSLILEPELLLLLATTTKLIELNYNFTELELINKLIELSLILLKKRNYVDEILNVEEKNANITTNNSKLKKKKSKDSTPLSDLLSHAELFELNPSTKTRETILDFFNAVIINLPKLSPNFRIKICKFIVSESTRQFVLNNGKITSEFKKSLTNLIIYPSNGEVFSLLPIAKRLLPENEMLSLLSNPRLPPIDVKYAGKTLIIEPEEEDDEEEEAEQQEEATSAEVADADAEQKPNFSEQVSTFNRSVSKDETAVEVFETAVQPSAEAGAGELVFKQQPDEAEKRSFEDAQDEEETPSKRLKTGSAVQEARADEAGAKEDDDSDFEIPEIALESDEE